MKLDKFILEYDTAGDKDKFLKSCIKKVYVPFAEKDAVCRKIIEASCYQKIGEKRIFKVDHAMRYFLFMIEMINYYTSISSEIDKSINLYDELSSRHILNKLLSYIDEEEYKEFSTLLTMRYDSEVENNSNIVTFISNKIDELGSAIDILSQTTNIDSELADEEL